MGQLFGASDWFTVRRRGPSFAVFAEVRKAEYL